MSIRIPDNLFKPEDTARFDNSRKGASGKREYINEGPGKYRCRVAGYRVGHVEKAGANYDKAFQSIDLDIIEVLDDGSHFGVGAKAASVILNKAHFHAKMMAEVACAVSGLPGCVIIPEGMPHEGKLLQLVGAQTINDLAEHDFENEPCFVQVRVYAVEKKGKTYHNVEILPDGGRFPTVEALIEAGVPIADMARETYDR